MILKRTVVLSVFLCLAQLNAFGQENKHHSPAPMLKGAVEGTIKNIISVKSAPLSALDALRPEAEVQPRLKPGSGVQSSTTENRLEGKHVQPGLVNWSTDTKTAFRNARKSKKPVLIFQMIGRLDDEFC